MNEFSVEFYSLIVEHFGLGIHSSLLLIFGFRFDNSIWMLRQCRISNLDSLRNSFNSNKDKQTRTYFN